MVCAFSAGDTSPAESTLSTSGALKSAPPGMGSRPMTAGSTAIEPRGETRELTPCTRSSITPVTDIWLLSQMTWKTMTTSSSVSVEVRPAQATRAASDRDSPDQNASSSAPAQTESVSSFRMRLSTSMKASEPSTLTMTGALSRRWNMVRLQGQVTERAIVAAGRADGQRP